MPLPHSLFGAQVHEPGKRHWWQRHPLPKVRRMLRRTPKTLDARASLPGRESRTADTFERDAHHGSDRPQARAHIIERPQSPATPPRPVDAPAARARGARIAPILATGKRDAVAEEALRVHFEEVGYDNATDALRGVHPSVALHIADAALEAGAHKQAMQLYALANARADNHARVPKHLQRRAHKAAECKDAVAQRVSLQAWMETQPSTMQSLSWGCLEACVLNPGIARAWYLRAAKLAKKQNEQAGFDSLSHALLRALCYAMMFDGAVADTALLQAIETKDPQLLSWAANGVRAAGNLELADSLERRAQALSAR